MDSIIAIAFNMVITKKRIDAEIEAIQKADSDLS